MVIFDNITTKSEAAKNFLHAESMSHWLHCNGCYCMPASVELRFYITNCSHIYCEKCVTQCTKERCKVCRSECTTLMLGGKIPQEVEALFTDPMELHQKMTKQFYQTLEFQKSHQRRLVRQFKEKVKVFEQKMREVKSVIMQAQSMEREFIKLKAENDYLKLLLSKKDTHPSPRLASRTGISPAGMSANLYSGSPNPEMSFGKSMTCGNNQQRSYGGTSNILNQPGRLLVRTPPSDGHLGTVGSLNYTPSTVGSKSSTITPISIPRPIHLHKKE